MGGYGCLMLALRHPDLFESVVSYGAALIEPSGEGDKGKSRWGPKEHSDKFNVWVLARKNADAVRKGISIRMVCGDQDGLYPRNVKFKELLDELKIPVDWVVVPGVAHDTKGLYVKVGLESLKFIEAGRPAKPAGRDGGPGVVLDVDLTRGGAGPGVVAGGKWDAGWRTTGALRPVGRRSAAGAAQGSCRRARARHRKWPAFVPARGHGLEPLPALQAGRGDALPTGAAEAAVQCGDVRSLQPRPRPTGPAGGHRRHAGLRADRRQA